MLCMKLIELQTAFSAIRAARWCKSDAYIMLLWKECDKELEWLRYSLCVHTVLSFHSEKKNKNTDKLTAWSGPLWSHSVSNASVLFWLFTQFFSFFLFSFFLRCITEPSNDQQPLCNVSSWDSSLISDAHACAVQCHMAMIRIRSSVYMLMKRQLLI